MNETENLNPEDRVAAAIARHRTEAGLTYEALAARMKAEGVTIHPSAIQKSEKSGRKVSIDEMVAYASIFGVPVESLWGGVSQEASIAAAWRDFIAAEKVLNISYRIMGDYRDLIDHVREEAQRNPALHAKLQQQLAHSTAYYRDQLHNRYDQWTPADDEDGNPMVAPDGSQAMEVIPIDEEFIDEELEKELPSLLAALRDALGIPRQREQASESTVSSDAETVEA